MKRNKSDIIGKRDGHVALRDLLYKTERAERLASEFIREMRWWTSSFIRTAVEGSGISRADICKRMGISKPTLHHWEIGKRHISEDRMRELLDIVAPVRLGGRPRKVK